MARRSETRLTLEQFYQLPDLDDPHELVRGRLVAEPPPGAQHGFVAARLCSALDQYIQRGGRPGVVLTCDTWFELARQPATVRGPDVAFITLERYRALADVRRAVPGAPDLAVEVRSPSESASAMRAKVDDYLAAGASEVWVVDPDARQVSAYRREQPTRTFVAEQLLTAPDILPGFGVPVAELLDAPA